MPRRRKVPLIKGEKRIRTKKGGLEIVQSLFCGECKKRTISSFIQRNAVVAKRENLPRFEEVARVCLNVEGHKDGKKYFWPLKNVTIPVY